MADKLKNLRLKAGLNQNQVAELIKTTISEISKYENETVLPDLEDAVIIEKKFSQKIDWKETLTPSRKHLVIQALIELTERFPLPMVLEFSARVYRREQAPDSLIIHYSKVIQNEGSLLPNLE